MTKPKSKGNPTSQVTDNANLEKRVEGAHAPTAAYGIDLAIMSNFLANVTFMEDGSYYASHKGAFEDLKKLYSGISLMEFDTKGVPKKGGVPREMLSVLAPSEILALYMASHDYKSKNEAKQSYASLVSQGSVNPIVELIEKATEKSYYLRQIKKRERGIAPLNERLSMISEEVVSNFYWAFSLNSRKRNDTLGTGRETEKEYLSGVNSYIAKIILDFSQISSQKSR